MMKKAYKSELDPNKKQVTSMRRHVGAARWAYKWGIERIKPAAERGSSGPVRFVCTVR
jgi:putative transposase